MSLHISDHTGRCQHGRLGDRLVADGLLTNDQLERALDLKSATNEFLGEILVRNHFVTPAVIGPYLEDITGFPFIDFGDVEIDRNIASTVSPTFAQTHFVLPLRKRFHRVEIAMVDPLNFLLVDELRVLVGQPIQPCLALKTDLVQAVQRTFDTPQRAYAVLEELEEAETAQPVPEMAEAADEDGEIAPVVRLVSGIISDAIAAEASDIHIEPFEANVRVRYRIDGLLYDQMTFARSHLNACISRLKVMSGLNIAERRLPQDGRFSTVAEKEKAFDVRLSLIPTVYGEKACMRLLPKSTKLAAIDRLGLTEQDQETISGFVHRPHGLVLVTGPTGSGKSTTLQASLQLINDLSRNISTIEDPVELKIPGVNQSQVNARIGFTFATGLRSLVRQDPDVIMVGEIRDKETAEIAVQAALTGHLVISTLHTNDAASSVTRLHNMGVEPFLISSALVGVVAQRLMRLNCPHCLEIQPLGQALDAFNIPGADPDLPVAHGKGCKRCGKRGTKGRTAVVEILSINDQIRELIIQGESSREIEAVAYANGMTSLRDAAFNKVKEHKVSPLEMVRVFAEAV